jgi:PAS domain S-box-containing protein
MSRSRSFIFETLLGKSTDLFFVVNEDLVIEDLNRIPEEILRYPIGALRGTSFINLIEKEEQFLVKESLKKARLNEGGGSCRVRALNTNEEPISLELSVFWSSEDRLFYASASVLGDDAASFGEREIFQYMFRDNPMPMVIWDFGTLKFIECNIQALKIYGYTREEFLQLDVTQIRPEEDIPLILDAAKSEEAYRNIKKRWRHLKKSGELMHVDTYTKIIDYKGRRAALVHISDITEKVEAEEELLKAYKKVSDYKFALDESSIVAITDATGTITYVNDNFTRISKYTREELIGANHSIVNSGFHDQSFFQTMWHTISGGEVWRGEVRNRAKDGSCYWVDATIVPFLDGQNRPYQYMAVRFDITEKKKSEENILIKTKLLSAIAEVISTLFQYENWEDALDASFGIVGKAISVDRVYYFENYVDPLTHEGFANQRLEWTAVSAHAQLDNPELQNLPFNIIDDFIVPLRNNQPFTAIVSEMEDTMTKELLVAQEIQSILVLPIFLKGYFYGFIGFDDCKKEREWREDEISFLKTLTSKLTSAIEKRRNMLDLQDALTEKSHILESIGDAFFAVDKTWTVTYWNKRAEDILGVKKDEILGQNLWKVFNEEAHSSFYTFYGKSMNEKKPVHFEVYYDALAIWLEVSSYPSPSGLSIYFKNISGRKESEERLKKMNKELALSNSELEQFAFVASHDLQEPLRMITSFLSQLEKRYGDLLDDRAKRYIYFASDGAKRMRNIILDLLEFSRVGRTKEDKQQVSLDMLLDEVVGLNRKLIQEKKARIVWDKGLPELYTFKSPLRLVFQNLINNGLKYQAKEAVPVITITSKELESGWHFIVADNGIGIDSEYFDKIFTIFQRLHNKEEYSGTGVGLAICKKIIENLEGEIWVTSELGEGSEFHFILPK